MRRLAKLCAFATSLPTIALASDQALRTELRAFVQADGLLHLNHRSKLSPEVMQRLRANLGELPQALIAGVDTMMAVADTGASSIGTPIMSDFIEGTYVTLSTAKSISGIASGLQIKGEGVVRYEMLDRNGNIRPIECPAYYIPNLPVRLIPPQVIFPKGSKGKSITENGEMRWEFMNGQIVDLVTNPVTNLPELRLFHDVYEAAEQVEQALYSCVTEELNQNLTPSMKQLLRLHFRLGHLAMPSLKWLARHGFLGVTAKSLATASEPMCGTCQYAKQTRIPSGATVTRVREEKEGGLKANQLEPGDGTAIDQFEVVKKGRLFASRGKERPQDRYSGGTIFVDIASGRVRCYYQHSLGSDETVKSKLKYEQEARQYGVFVKAYHSDNGIFTATEFQLELQKQDQCLTLAGVGAHHQNAVAERAIRTVVTRARALLLHAMLRWPDVMTPDLWPMAIQHAELLCNHVPKQSHGYSPLQLFSRSIGHARDNTFLETIPVWGCPAYVLMPTLQDGKKLPKWQPRSRRGQFVGLSPFHASNVALVRNLHSGSIGPQYHVVFDNWFETVTCDETETPPEWEVLVTHSRYQAEFDEDDLQRFELDSEWLTKEELAEQRERIKRERDVVWEQRGKPERETSTEPHPTRTDSRRTEVPETIPERETTPTPEPPSPVIPTTPGTQSEREFPTPSDMSPLIDVTRRVGVEASPARPEGAEPKPKPVPDEDSPLLRTTPVRTRFGRQIKKPTRWIEKMLRAAKNPRGSTSVTESVACFLSLADQVAELVQCGQSNSFQVTAMYNLLLATNPDTGIPELGQLDPESVMIALKAKKNSDPDTLTYNEAMRSQYVDEFVEAMRIEVEALTKLGTWQGVLRSSLPRNGNVLPSTWAFKIKRWPNGLIRKFKARFCVRGDRQIEGVDVFETYAPVVAWSTVRCLLAFSLDQNLVTRQIDVSNAFPNAVLPEHERIFLEPPKGFSDPSGQDIVLQLLRNQYGLRQAPLHWFNHLKGILESQRFRFEQSKEDPCMFL